MDMLKLKKYLGYVAFGLGLATCGVVAVMGSNCLFSVYMVSLTMLAYASAQ